MLTSREIRDRFIQFFEQEGHTHVPSASLVPPGEDQSLLFNNAGMNQFKDVFTGAEQRAYSRAVTIQRCVRAGGKHNDLENVGPSARHHTFFEMMGNFSFGDYFKRDAIRLAWKLFTEVWELPPDRLWPTVYQDDDEAFELWQTVAGVPAARITRLGAKDNFWAMGDTGPCGPDSEIFWDYHPERTGQPGHNPGEDEESFIELWNLVFMQFDQLPGGVMVPLPRPSVDTGAGIERVTAILQGKASNYETDIFTPLMDKIRAISGQTAAEQEAAIVSYRVIADHSRAVTFLIGDGVQPGPTERGYVLRRILRRALWHGRLLGIRRPFLGEMAEVVLDEMGRYAPEILARREFILQTIRTEEDGFNRTLGAGISRFETLTADVPAGATVPGEDLFRLYDTFGLPRDLIEELVHERALTGDWTGYDAAFRRQQEQSKLGSGFKGGSKDGREIYQQVSPQPTAFLGYDYATLSAEGRVLGLVQAGKSVERAEAGQEVEIILDRTPFYAEGGGQVGDSGVLEWEGGRATVRDTRKPIAGVFAHHATLIEGALLPGQLVQATVQGGLRWDIMRNHTATHLLHKALRDVLGSHVQQAGSLVAPDRLRFDFSHNAPITRDTLDKIERIVNEGIIADYPVDWTVMPYAEAIATGAMALFGEKYGSEVRLVQIPGYESRELCGGTHVQRTGQIGACYIISEGSIGSNVRRIECVTGRGAVAWVQGRNALLAQAAATVQAQPDRLIPQLTTLQTDLRAAQKRITLLERQIATGTAGSHAEDVREIAGLRVLVGRSEAASADSLRQAADHLRDKLGSDVVVLGSVIDGKPSLVAMATAAAVGQGAHAGRLLKEIAPLIGGGAGGRPELAQAGGRDATKLDAALATVPDALARQLDGH
ncbi:MAG: alanine--tRNA ligase [Chloroflexota bacterium]|nr:alanine--tRNA ligase [Chloroflexota bacterium]